jgi:hypothetical protein
MELALESKENLDMAKRYKFVSNQDAVFHPLSGPISVESLGLFVRDNYQHLTNGHKHNRDTKKSEVGAVMINAFKLSINIGHAWIFGRLDGEQMRNGEIVNHLIYLGLGNSEVMSKLNAQAKPMLDRHPFFTGIID